MSDQSDEPGTIITASVKGHPASTGLAVECSVWIPDNGSTRYDLGQVARNLGSTAVEQLGATLSCAEVPF